MKKRLPLHVLETLEKYVQLTGEQFEVIDPEDFLLKIIDKEKSSDFYFNLEGYKVDNGLKLLVDWKPINKESTANSKKWITDKQLDGYFSNWVALLERYETVNSFFDDPIIKSFADEYFAEFEIIDEDSDIKPLNPKQILLLDEHLEYIEKNIEKYQTENNASQIQDIKSEIIELRENLTSKTKTWVVRNLSNIWAKITKQGTPLLKEFLSETKKIAIKEGIQYLIEQGTTLIN